MLFFLFSKGSLWISKSVKDIRIVLVILRFWNVRILASLFLNISHNLNFFHHLSVSLIAFTTIAFLTIMEFTVYRDTWMKYEYEVDKDFTR